MTDPAHKYSDEQIAAFQREVASLFEDAAIDAQNTLDAYLAKFVEQDTEKQAQVAEGELSKEEWLSWRRRKITTGKSYEAKKEQAAWFMTNASTVAMNTLNGKLPEVYAENYNYGMFSAETLSGIDTTFTLLDGHTVQNMLKDSKSAVALPEPKVPIEKNLQWNKRIIGNHVLAGIVTGESIPKIAKRVAQEVGNTNYKSAVRVARTTVTAAQNAGRISSYKDAAEQGIEGKKEWLAAHDEKTRASHRLLDGAQVDVEEDFANGCAYPGDPSAPYGEIANCRCTLVFAVDGIDMDDMNDMSEKEYEAWKYGNVMAPPESSDAELEAKLKALANQFYIQDPQGRRYRLDDKKPITSEELDKLEKRMRKLANTPANALGDDNSYIAKRTLRQIEAYRKALGEYERISKGLSNVSIQRKRANVAGRTKHASGGKNLSLNQGAKVYKKLKKRDVKGIEEVFQSLPESVAHKLYVKYEHRLKLYTANKKKGTAYYKPTGRGQGVNIDFAADKKDYPGTPKHSTWFHEFAHNIDYLMEPAKYSNYSSTYKNGAFGAAIMKDYQNLKKQYGTDANISRQLRKLSRAERCDISDILHGSSNERVDGGFGHYHDPNEESYWNNPSHLPGEAFANITSAYISNEKSLNQLQKWLPETMKVYNEMCQSRI